MDLTVTALAAFIAIFKEVVTISLTAQRHFPANTSPRCNSIHVCSESIPTGLSLKSAEVVVMTAFEALRFKDIARQQLFSSVKSICSPSIQKELKGADKSSLTQPLAAALLINKVVEVKKGADLQNLKRLDAKKFGTF